ncbi:MAG: beta-galactosidase [Anaerolineae bacterium]|nr:beta-galactosidase [Anaerolineae bacterium]
MFVTDVWLMASLRRYRFWYLRLLIAGFVISGIAAAGPRATLETPQVVQTEKPLVCVHTRLIDEVWEWKIQRSLQLVREMGADTIVEFFPWAYIENTKDQYDWASADRIVRHAENQGIQVIARLGFVPAWARPDVEDQNSTLNYLPEDSYADFADFVGDFAARYAGTVNRIIIWNEPNLAFEWGYQPIDPAGYVRLLQAVYPVAHAANPDIEILAAPLAPTLEPNGSPNGLDDLLYVEQLYEAKMSDYVDAVAIHTYGFTDPPQGEPAPDKLNFRRAELLHDIMTRYETETKPVYITETGWNDHPRWTKAVRPAQRIAYTLDAYHFVEESWPWVDKMCLWAFRFPAPTQSYPDNFTLVTPDFQLKPLYFALQAYARGWERNAPLWLPPPASDS